MSAELLDMLCEKFHLDCDVTLRYVITRLWQDEVMRSEIKAMEWAEKRFGHAFASTVGVFGGDLLSMKPREDEDKVLVEVTTEKRTNLSDKAMHSANQARIYGDKFNRVAGVRIDPTSNQVLEVKVIDLRKIVGPIRHRVRVHAKPFRPLVDSNLHKAAIFFKAATQ